MILFYKYFVLYSASFIFERLQSEQFNDIEDFSLSVILSITAIIGEVSLFKIASRIFERVIIKKIVFEGEMRISMFKIALIFMYF